jgi:hypothetical protein
MWLLLLVVMIPVVVIGTLAIMVNKTIRYINFAGDQ